MTQYKLFLTLLMVAVLGCGKIWGVPDCSSHSVTWHIDGATQVDENVSSCDGVQTLPSINVADVRCKAEGTTFMGWSETNVGYDPVHIAPADLFTDASHAPAITEDKDFYAVFAQGTPAAVTPQMVTYSISAKDWLGLSTTGTPPPNSGAGIDQTYTVSEQMTAGNSQTLTLWNFGDWKITQIVLSMKSNQNSGAGILSYSVDGETNFDTITSGAFNTAAWNGSYTTNYTEVTKNVNIITEANKYLFIKLKATENSIFCRYYRITYEPIVTYDDYFTECCPRKAITIADLDEAVGTITSDVSLACEDEKVTLSKTENHYNFTGWKVYKTGDESTTVTVTDNQFDMPAYPVTIEATWTPKDYKITIAEAANGSATIKESTTYSQDGDGKWIVPYGSTVTLVATPSDEYHYFSSWTLSPENPSAAIDQAEMEITMPGDFTATPVFGNTTVVADGEKLVIDEATILDNLIIEKGGAVRGSGILTVNNLTFKTSLGAIDGCETPSSTNGGGKSSEILNPENINATGDVWIEIELTKDDAASEGWYAFSVPFPVDALNGVYYGNTKLQNEVGYAIMSHDGALRAQNVYAWKKFRGIMQPGEFYVITVGDTDYKTLRFKKVTGTKIFNEGDVVGGQDNNQMSVNPYESSIAGNHAGWNGLGNPYLESAHIGSLDLQFYDHANNKFWPYQGDSVNLMVGSAFFYQASLMGDAITIKKSDDGNIALAPARTVSSIEQTTFKVYLSNANGRLEDKLFLRTSEDATNEYVIGRDLAKMSMGTAKCAQMYVPAYGTQLCAADFPLINNKAEYPLTIHAPAAGTYSISTAANENADLFLTYEGSIIWNLSESAYELDLNKGTTNGYGLLLQAKIPQTPTGIEESVVSGQYSGVQKIVINDQVFIIRGGKMYDVTGKMGGQL